MRLRDQFNIKGKPNETARKADTASFYQAQAKANQTRDDPNR
jgi:hypothetical protein